ncbi:MAG: ABC transporter ATP-binding protein [Anaeromassilibacillus sp.]
MRRKMPLFSLTKQIFGLLQKRQKRSFWIVLLILAVSAGLSQILPLAVGYLTDRVLVDRANISFQTTVPVLLVILITSVVNEVIKVIRRLLVEDASTQAEKEARNRAAASLMLAPMRYFRQNMTGNIHGRLNRSIEGTTKLVKLIFMDFAPAVATGIAAVFVIFSQLPWQVALLMVLVVPVGTLIVMRQISTQKGIRVELLQTKADLDGIMVELLGGMETIRSMDSAEIECARIDRRSEALRTKEMKHHRAMAFYDCLKFINEAAFNVAVIGISVLLAFQGAISVGTVLTAYLCFTQLTGPLRELHRILDEVSECTVLASDYFQILGIPKDFSYAVQGEKRVEKWDSNDIQMQHLRFHYAEEPDKPILEDLNLQVGAGKFIGIAGPSGCGKSTVTKAIDKLEETEGTITIGGYDLAALTRADLAEAVVLVPQVPFLFADTIFHNICYGIKREVTLEEVREAARRASIDADIMQMPGQYAFLVAEAGHNLSGGQRQRIALARAFLRTPRILILDEATSALDNTSEKQIQVEFERMKEVYGTTILSIAHRLTTLKNCDQIVVMDHGKIVQQGTYDSLREQPGLFRDMSLGIVQ